QNRAQHDDEDADAAEPPPILTSTFAVPVPERGHVLGDEASVVRKIPFFEADLVGVSHWSPRPGCQDSAPLSSRLSHVAAAKPTLHAGKTGGPSGRCGGRRRRPSPSSATARRSASRDGGGRCSANQRRRAGHPPRRGCSWRRTPGTELR